MKENYQVRENEQASGGVATTLHDAASVQIMKAIIELYAKPGEAVLREVTSNAWDSHQQAGQTRPVEVTLPRYGSRELIIEDFGVGLDWSEIPNAFAKIGFSTKLHNNQQRGKFGFGAKSPILLADTFTITAVKNGMLTVVECRKTADGIGELFLQSQQPTAAPNGVKLTIPLKGNYQFDENEILTNFFIGWDQHSIRVNGQFPTRCLHDESQFIPLTVGEDVVGWVSREPAGEQYGSKIYASFLGVIYRLKQPDYYDAHSDAYRKLNGYGHLVYLNMPASSVEVTPSREELQYNSVTNNALKIALEMVVRSIEMRTQQQLDLAPSREAAMRLYVEARNARLWLANLSYRGERIPDTIEVRDPFFRLRKKERKKNSNTFNDFTDMTGNSFEVVNFSTRTSILVKVDDITVVQGLRRKFSLFHEGYRKAHDVKGKNIDVYFHAFDIEGSWLAAAATEVFTAADYNVFVKAGRETYEPEPKNEVIKRYMVAEEMPVTGWTIKVSLMTAEEIREAAGERPIVRIPYAKDRIGHVATHRNLRNYRSIRVKAGGKLVMRTLQETALVVYTENQTMGKHFERAFPEHHLAEAYMRNLAQVEFERVREQFVEIGVAAYLRDHGNYHWGRNYSFTKFANALTDSDLLAGVREPELRDLLASLTQPLPQDGSYKRELLDWFNMNPRVNPDNQAKIDRANQVLAAFHLFPGSAYDYNSPAKVSHLLAYVNTVDLPAVPVPEASQPA